MVRPHSRAHGAGRSRAWDTVTGEGELTRWETAWAQGGSSAARLFRPELLADPRCAISACRRGGDLIAGIIAYTADPGAFQVDPAPPR